MKRCGKIAVCLAAGLALDAALRADDVALTGNPYAMIVTRNIFSLNPPPPPADPDAAPAEPAVKITPNGIMSIFGQSQVLFKTSGGGKPGEQSYILGEGQREDEIEVVKIDEKAGIVTFNNHGRVQEIPLANATSPAAPAAPPVAMGFNPVAGRIIGFPPVAPGGAGNNGANGLNPSGNGGANNAAGRSLAGGQGGVNNGLTPQFGAATRNYTAPQPQQAPIDPDVQKVLIVANHLKAQLDGAPEAKIFPPTELDNEAGVTPNVAPATTPDSSSPQ